MYKVARCEIGIELLVKPILIYSWNISNLQCLNLHVESDKFHKQNTQKDQSANPVLETIIKTALALGDRWKRNALTFLC
mgnify:CR=1 FL=1